MLFPEAFALIVSFALSLWVVKASAQLAYKKEVSWQQAFVQWLLLAILAIVTAFVLEALKISYFLARIFTLFPF